MRIVDRRSQFGLFVALAAALLSACGAQTSNRVIVTPQPAQTPATNRDLATTIVVEGEVRNTVPVKLSFPNRGVIAEVDVRYGDVVSEGQKLAFLDSTEPQRIYDQAQRDLELLTARIEQMKAPPAALPEVIESAKANAQYAHAVYAELERTQDAASLALTKAKAEMAAADAEVAKLTKPTVLTKAQEQINSLELEKAQSAIDAAQLELEKTVMVSPCDCYVHDITINPGEVASEGSGMTLINTKDIYFHSSGLNERDFPLVEVGQPVVIHLKSIEQPLSGKIRAIITASGEMRNSIALFDLVIDIDDLATHKVSPGMTGQAEISLKKEN